MIFQRKHVGLIWIALPLLILSFFVQQDQFWKILSLYTIAFGGYLWNGLKDESHAEVLNLSFIIKGILLFAFPLASDDVYRFYWDGMNIANGISPYKFTPNQLLSSIPVNPEILGRLNSPDYYSVYPPVLQLIFLVCYWLSFSSVIVFAIWWKGLLLLADIGSIFFLKRIFPDGKQVYWYAWNPLILYEVFGNGHPEGLLLFALIGCIYYIRQNKSVISFAFLSLATAVKIFPFALFPFLLKHAEKRSVVTSILVAVFLLSIAFLPIYPHFDHFKSSLDLYFKSFEFNGSVFEIWKWIDHKRWGFDNIRQINKYLSGYFMVSACILYVLYWIKKNIIFEKYSLYIWAGYLLLASVVHPWYVLPVLALSIISGNVFGMVWSYLVVFSYSWYDEGVNKYLWVGGEYVLLIGLFLILHYKSVKFNIYSSI